MMSQHTAAKAGKSVARKLTFPQDAESFAKGKELFKNGLLSEAVLALEAEVQRQPGKVEAWRLLGTVHAENDDDQQVELQQPFPSFLDVHFVCSLLL